MNGKEFLESIGINSTDVWVVRDNRIELVNIPQLLDTFHRLNMDLMIDDLDFKKLKIDK